MLGSFEYVYFLWTPVLILYSFHLNLLCVFSDMLCTCIFHAVAHTQSHISHSLHCSSSCCACFLFTFSAQYDDDIYGLVPVKQDS